MTSPPHLAPALDIFAWRTAEKLGVPTITARLNASPAAYPTPSDIPDCTVRADQRGNTAEQGTSARAETVRNFRVAEFPC
jgi:hypothetical protein